jgi:hypothetical protein
MHDLGKTTNSNSTPHRPRRPENQFPKRAMFQMRVRVSVDRMQCSTYQRILGSCKLFARPYCSVFCNGGHLAKLELTCIRPLYLSHSTSRYPTNQHKPYICRTCLHFACPTNTGRSNTVDLGVEVEHSPA